MRLDLTRSPTLSSVATRWPSPCRALRMEENGVDADFPWRFGTCRQGPRLTQSHRACTLIPDRPALLLPAADGRLWFRPAFVRAPDPSSLPAGVSAVALLGWTVGGVVALEYDESPVRPCVDTYVPEPPYGTHGLRAPFSRAPYAPEAQGLPRRSSRYPPRA